MSDAVAAPDESAASSAAAADGDDTISLPIWGGNANIHCFADNRIRISI